MSSNGVIGTFLLKDLQDHEKYSCYMLYVELFEKKEKILKYTKIPEGEFLELLYIVLKRIDFINENQISKESWDQAIDLTKDIDIIYISFVALAIEMKGILWTGDKKLHQGLKEKGFERVANLEELRKLAKRK